MFEPLLREIHQKPDDYYRFTPYALEQVYKKIGFKNIKYEYSGGPFSATYYCWDQALQYLPVALRKKYQKKINLSELLKLENRFKKNLFRKYSEFPVSFSIECENV